MMSCADPRAVADLIRAVAREEIMGRFRALEKGDVQEKSGPCDLVTVADTAAEAALARGLADLAPGIPVVGEEGAADDPAVLDALYGSGPAWVVDPVDGTRAFSEGRAGFGVLLALVEDGATRAGWLYDPMADRLFYAAAGQGAWLDDTPLTIPAPPGLGPDASGALPRPWANAVRKATGCHTRGFASALGAYTAVARGYVQFAGLRALNPWDHAAGVLLINEAGGTARLLTGDAYHPAPDQGEILAAASPIMWEKVAQIIAKTA